MKRFKTIALITLIVEVISILTLVLMYYYDVFNFQETLKRYILFLIIAVVILVDRTFVFILILRTNSMRYTNNLKTTDIFGDNISESLAFNKLGIVVVDGNQDIIWINDELRINDFDMLDENMFELFPQLIDYDQNNEGDQNKIVQIKDLSYEVEYIKSSNVYFFKNVSDYNSLLKYSNEQKMVLGMVMIDNYDEIVEGQEETSDLLAKTRTAINDYFKEHGVLLRKYSNNSYFAISNYQSLEGIVNDNFSILDSIKELALADDVIPTLSIGFTYDFSSVHKLNEMANSAIEIAISRGGDQAVVSKYGSDLKFFGGKTEGIEKRNKVKVRVLADSFINLIKTAKDVLIMGHNDMDMDALGSALGIKAICDHLNIKSKIVYDYKLVERKTRNAFTSAFSKNQIDEISILPKDAINRITSKTILVCVDFHRPSLALSKDLVEACDKVCVIDHHRRSQDSVENPIFSYFDISASSASELIAELIKYASLNPAIEISSSYATIMLSGIFLDTNYFRTNSAQRTFEACSFLKGFGADNVKADDYLKDEYEEHLLISKVLSNIETLETGVVCCCCNDDDLIESPTIAKIANECIGMKGINAAFVIGKIDSNQIKISARSDGTVNVQLLAEKLGGGGHYSKAAAEFKSKSISDIKLMVKNVIEDYIDEARVEGTHEGD